MTTQEVVQELYDYLMFRFFKENRQVNLDLEFFARHFKDGVRGFFGVIVDEDMGLLEDRPPKHSNFIKLTTPQVSQLNPIGISHQRVISPNSHLWFSQSNFQSFNLVSDSRRVQGNTYRITKKILQRVRGKQTLCLLIRFEN